MNAHEAALGLVAVIGQRPLSGRHPTRSEHPGDVVRTEALIQLVTHQHAAEAYGLKVRPRR
jgi:hypothetical protein